jgi:hypothetical protein
MTTAEIEHGNEQSNRMTVIFYGLGEIDCPAHKAAVERSQA